MHRLLLTLWLALTALAIHAQTSANWQEVFAQWVETEGGETAQWEEAFDILSELNAHPVDLNTASREQLERIPFLSDQQVADILELVYRNGEIRSMGELLMMPSINRNLLLLLQHFVCLHHTPKGTPPLRLDSIGRHGELQLVTSAQLPLYSRKGDDNGYIGYPYAHTMRLQYAYGDRVKMGLTGGQDTGEPFFSNRNSLGYDHYSYYLQVNDLGRISRLCLGTYRVQMGLGLIMNGAFSLGKTTALLTASRSTARISGFSSRSTSGYLQGAAATVRLSPQIVLTAYGSYRPMDATLNDDGSARTLLSSNYHRTPKEMEKKNNTHLTDAGASIGWHHQTLYANLNMVFTHLDRPLKPQKGNTLYRRYMPEGSNFFNMSIDYGYGNRHFAIAGETAVNRQGALALLHRATWHMSNTTDVTLLHRYYDKRYTSMHAHSFAEGSSIQNEHGVYVGVKWQPSMRLAASWYADYAHFAWPRYRASVASDAFDTMFDMQWKHRKWTFTGRYRLHLRQRNNTAETRLNNHLTQRLRLQMKREVAQHLTWQTQLDGAYVTFHTHYWGWMAGQQLTWKTAHLQLAGRLSLFHTNNYESRLYQYEPSLRYDFYFPALYGEGMRYALLASANILRSLTLTAKLGVTNYFDRAKIGSGLQQINRSSQPDLNLQLAWKL